MTSSTAVRSGFDTYVPIIKTEGFYGRRLTVEDLKQSSTYSLLSQLTEAPIIASSQVEAIWSAIDPSLHYIIGIFNTSNELIAMATLFLEPKFIRGGSIVGHIEDVVVDEPYRRHGFGTQMIKNLINIARESGAYKVILDCNDKNLPFYGQCGMSRKENHCGIYL